MPSGGTAHGDHIYRMETFWQWLRLRSLLEAAWYSFNPAEYNRLFDSELEKVIARVKDPQALERLKGFDWLAYIVGSVWHAGYRDKRERDEKAHDIVVKLLTGRLFRGYDPPTTARWSRFRRSVGNAIRNLVAKEKTRRRYIPTIPIAQEFTPGSVTADDLPAKPARRRREGDRGLPAVGSAAAWRAWACRAGCRLSGGSETKSLVGCPSLGSPGKWTIKKVVAGIKALAREFFRGDPDCSEGSRWR